MPEIKGSCRCGKVTYMSSAEPIFAGVCHCRTCQKETGSAFGVVLGVPTPSLTLDGSVTRFDATADSGNGVHRAFCPVCGSTVVREADAFAGVTMLPVGTLDDPDWVKPTMQIYCDSAQPWVSLGAELQSFPKMPM